MAKQPPLVVKAVAPLVLIGGFLALLPRKEGPESYLSTTVLNPPPAQTPFDPYTYSGIADGSGGRETKTTYGAGAPGPFEGASELYGLLDEAELTKRQAVSDYPIFLVPDPTGASIVQRYLASVYRDRDGRVIDRGPLAASARN